MAKFTLTSPDFASGATLANAQVFNGMGFKGGNVSRRLRGAGHRPARAASR